MDWLTKQKTYVWLIIVLVVINLTTLIFLWTNRTSPIQTKLENFRGTDSFLKTELGLSDEQDSLFRVSRDKFFESTRMVNEIIWGKKKEIKDEGFKNNPDTSKVNKLTDEIGKLQSEIEQAAFEHFADVNSMLSTEQAEKFKKILDRGPGHPRGHDNKRPPGPPPFDNHPPG